MSVVAVVGLLFCALFTSVCMQAESDEMQEIHEAKTDAECTFFPFSSPKRGRGNFKADWLDTLTSVRRDISLLNYKFTPKSQSSETKTSRKTFSVCVLSFF